MARPFPATFAAIINKPVTKTEFHAAYGPRQRNIRKPCAGRSQMRPHVPLGGLRGTRRPCGRRADRRARRNATSDPVDIVQGWGTSTGSYFQQIKSYVIQIHTENCFV